MPYYRFKLMGTLDERGRKTIKIEEDSTIEQVKLLVRQAFKMPPGLQISLLMNGVTLSDDYRKWATVSAIPGKTIINVIGTR